MVHIKESTITNHRKLKKRGRLWGNAGLTPLSSLLLLHPLPAWWPEFLNNAEEEISCRLQLGTMIRSCSETLVPSSFFRLGSLFVASSIHVPSAECFSSRGFPTNTRSTRHGSSASLTNSPATHAKHNIHHSNFTNQRVKKTTLDSRKIKTYFT